MSLYRKYRPQTFEHLVGQNHVSQTLLNALKLDRVNHAYLFTGPRGTGKTSTARLLAKALNCTNLQDSEPCNTCEICQEISEGRLIDIIEIDAASNRGIDEMRDLREKINFAPTRAKTKVYIIDEVHMLTKEAFNALLKTLEEPPSHVYFVLATTEVHKIPETILSRCQRFDFKRLDDQVLIDRLAYIAKEEKIQADEKALEIIAHHAEGGMRDAIGLLEQLTVDNAFTLEHVSTVLGVSGYESLQKLYDSLAANDVQAAVQEIHDLYVEGHDLSYFTKRFLEFLRKKMLASVEEKRLDETTHIVRTIEHFQRAYDRSRYATIPQLPLEMAIVQSCVSSDTPVSEAKPVPQERPAAPAPTPQKKSTAPPPPERNHQPITPSAPAAPSEQSAEKKSPKFDAVKKQWPRIMEHIKSPIARRSLQQGVPLEVDGKALLLAFSSQFHLDKMMEIDLRTDVEHAIQEVLGAPLKIKGEVRKVQVAVNTEAHKTDEPDEPKSALAKEVMDMFEGELA